MATVPEGGDGTPPAGGGPERTVPTCYRHAGRETYIRCSRCERYICPDCMTAAPVGFHCPECVAEGTKSVRAGTTALGGEVRERGDLVTKALIGLNLAVFLVGMFGGQQLIDRVVLAKLAVVVDAGQPALIGVQQGEWYRMLTAAFTHEQVWHIALNMFALWILGSSLEPVLGRWRFIALYVLSALGGSAASLIGLPVVDLADRFAGGVSLGASGAVFGLFGAMFVVARRFGRDVSSVLVILGINVVIGFTVPGIDWRAHLGGLVAGTALAMIYAHAPRQHRSRYSIAGCLVLVAVIAFVMVALVA